MARVNVDARAFTDPRFVTLGRQIGADRWAALGRMAVLWNECTERGLCELPRDFINDCHPDVDSFAAHVIAAELGRETAAGTVYLCGTRGRVEWLEKKRVNGRKTGPLGAKFGQLGGRPKKPVDRVIENPVTGLPENPPLALALALESKPKDTVFLSTTIREWFTEAWRQYPKKKGKADALRHYAASVKTPEDRDCLLRHLANYRAQLAAERTAHRYTLNGSTWFANWRDEDYAEPPTERPAPIRGFVA